ncbi:MAG TPA: HAD-IB family hydrolase [Segeticoccus sp.]|uniref:HAD family hydrolase n=1 Tax=Segeticoccus sp. TaxID=2706531 RepID=UPI002D7F9D0D|nr:HAD-IB family hydrolase [Segeticoccus sp.]HET8599179.1 HAD-IB family hydrolase [Segeticoccus sp.]
MTQLLRRRRRARGGLDEPADGVAETQEAQKPATEQSAVAEPAAEERLETSRGPAAAAELGPEAAPAQPGSHEGVAAFFDLDNTVLRGASIFFLARGMWQREFFGVRDIAAMAWKRLHFSLVGESLKHVDEIREQALGVVAGRSVAEINAAGADIYDEVMAQRLWPGTVALARQHLADGDQVWLVTASPVELAEMIAGRLGFSGALGTIAEQRDGVYTGRLIGDLLHGEEKAAAVRALADKHGLDLQRCSAYSDSAHDIPLLSLVGDPCAVNPDSKLRAHAQAHGWRIRDFRTKRKVAKHGLQALGATALTGVLAAAGARRLRR